MDEAMTAIADELATPAIETQEQPAAPTETEGPVDLDAEVSTETEAEPAEQEPAEEGAEPTEEAPEEPELVDIEVNGKTFKVPAELKDGYLMQADYTRKTQEVAALRKEGETLKEQAAALYQTSQEYIEAKAYAHSLDQQLKQYEGVDWNQHDPNDPYAEVELQRHWRNFQQLQQRRQQVDQYLQNADHQRTAQAEQDIANRLQETRKFAEEKIPGWTPEVDAKVVNFATSELGFTVEQIKAAINPGIYKTLHLAWLGSQALQKQQTAPRPAAPTQPLKTVSSKASPVVTKNPEDMSMEEYARWRSSQTKR